MTPSLHESSPSSFLPRAEQQLCVPGYLVVGTCRECCSPVKLMEKVCTGPFRVMSVSDTDPKATYDKQTFLAERQGHRDAGSEEMMGR